MKQSSISMMVFTIVVLAGASANASIQQITATSAAHGELGWFQVDNAIFVTKVSLKASDFVDFSFADPLGTSVFNPGNVPADTGLTYLVSLAEIGQLSAGVGLP